jgi:hypothetical protein
MFGLTSFSEAPFASLAKANIFLSLSENFGAADSCTVLAAFQLSIAEPITLDDSSTQQSNFFAQATENLNSADVQTVVAAFQAAITENVVLADGFSVTGWIKIINVQAANWANVDAAQTPSWTNINNSQ